VAEGSHQNKPTPFHAGASGIKKTFYKRSAMKGRLDNIRRIFLKTREIKGYFIHKNQKK
jgi:hypothetical protein